MTDQRASLSSGLTGDRWYIYRLSDGTLGAVPATVTDEAAPVPDPSACGCGSDWRKPKPNGTCATCGGWLPGEKPFSLTAMWRGNPPPSLQAAPVRANNGGGIEVMRVSDCEALRGTVDAIAALLPKVYDGMHLVDCPYVDVLLKIRAALGEPSHETKET